MNTPPKKPTTFSEALATRTAITSRIDQIAADLGEEQGKLFMEALMQPDADGKYVKILKIQAALKEVGVAVSHSTLGMYRRDHDV